MPLPMLDASGYVSRLVYDRLADEVRRAPEEADSLIVLAADLLRHDALLCVARAAAGAIGSALSMAELVAEVYFRRDFQPGPEADRDRFVLSKGHAAPLLYAALAARGAFPARELDRLGRKGGLPVHPNASTAGIDATTGSLGIGLSHAVGLALAQQRHGGEGRVFVVCGDGELQQGQVWEALLSASSYACEGLYLLLDANGVQADQRIDDVLCYHDLPGVIQALGLAVEECDGHDPNALFRAFEELAAQDRPKCLFAHTVKGKGVSFLEHPEALQGPDDRYAWDHQPLGRYHLAEALDEVLDRCRPMLREMGVAAAVPSAPSVLPDQPEDDAPLTGAFSQALLELAHGDERVVVLDADLEEHGGLAAFREAFPERFYQMGIMQQHLVSAAAGFAALGEVAIVSGHAAFLAARANEQVSHLAAGPGLALLVGHFAGVVPTAAGAAQLGFRDIAALRGIAGLRLYQPACPLDVERVVARFARGELGAKLYLRMATAAAAVELPSLPAVPSGHAQVARPGDDAILITAGPVLLGEALAAAQALAIEGHSVEVRHHPWLAEHAPEALRELADRGVPVVVVEDHHRLGGLGEGLFAGLARAGLALPALAHLALDGPPPAGSRGEVLEAMGLGRQAMAKQLRTLLKGRARRAS